MAENQNEDTIRPITSARSAQFATHTEQAMAVGNIPAEQDKARAEQDAKANKLTGVALTAGAAVLGAALLGGTIKNTFESNELPQPQKPVGVSETSVPYELGSESIDGNKIDTMSEVALQVTKNIPGEQGGLDVVAADINRRTDAYSEAGDLSNTVWVPENADVSTAPGTQLVEVPTRSPEE